ncbi:MAG TPA: GDP-mannose 4,6-dehydratase [Bryobacteraceae bacterium]|nr:GDP-mannose 4,6-dehydratase [Bryobacteraceae bacterium]
MKKALVTGITGQDGSFLAEFLIAKGYQVHGIVRRASTFNTDRLDQIYADPHETGVALKLHYGDLTDGASLRHIIEKVQPQEIYNLGAQSHVRVSFEQVEYTADVVATGALRLLEAVRDYCRNTARTVRFYQASSSEMFGAAPPPQNETTPFYPRSPYAVSKVAAHWYAVNYREAYGLFISSGILFNHESERRGETFVTRKITRALGRIRYGLQDKLYLGNLEARRDWGHAGDYVEAMWLMLQQPEPGDFVIATGESHSVREFLELASKYAGVDGQKHVATDPRYFRPTEVDFLCGDSSKAHAALGWKPKMTFPELVRTMVEHDLELARQEQTLTRAGHKVVVRGVSQP